jgi:aspartyl protease family protein
MALSSGGRGVLTEVLGWIALLGIGAVAVLNYASIRSVVIGSVETQAAGAKQAGRVGEESRRSTSNSAELRAGHNGHFVTDADVNGRAITVMVDTGASMVALTYADARAIGVAPSPREFTQRVSTANGVARVAPVMLDRIQIGDVTVRNVQAAVVEDGKLSTTLLGNTFLSKLSRYEMRNGRLVMEE